MTSGPRKINTRFTGTNTRACLWLVDQSYVGIRFLSCCVHVAVRPRLPAGNPEQLVRCSSVTARWVTQLTICSGFIISSCYIGTTHLTFWMCVWVCVWATHTHTHRFWTDSLRNRLINKAWVCPPYWCYFSVSANCCLTSNKDTELRSMLLPVLFLFSLS